MINLTVLVEKEGDIFIAKNLEFGVISQGRSSDDAVKNLREATELYLEGENKDTLFSELQNKQYSLTMMSL